MNKKKKLPRCIAVVDFEHWYISLERQYSMKPDIKAWKDGLEKDYNIEEIAFFGDFSNQGLRGELDKIRNATSMIIDTQNNSEYYKKDFTDFIMLDYIYQKDRHIHNLHGRRTFQFGGSFHNKRLPQKSRHLRHNERRKLTAKIRCVMVSRNSVGHRRI